MEGYQMKKYVIGIDGGGTKTDAVLVDHEGAVIGRQNGGSSNYLAIGGEELRKVLLSVIGDLLAKTDVTDSEITHIYMGFAGAGRKEDREAITGLFDNTPFQGRVSVVSDAVIALMGAFAGRPGVILISGTGSICFGVDSRGELIRSGGWGYMLGDEGSGFYIGHEAIIYALKYFDGRGVKTTLKKVIENKFNVSSIDFLVPLIYQNKIDRVAIADLAPSVFEEAGKGDKVAADIIRAAGLELGKMIKAVIRKMKNGVEQAEIALIGSVFKQKDILVPYIQEELSDLERKIEIIEPIYIPSIGAAMKGLILSGVKINESVLKNLNGINDF